MKKLISRYWIVLVALVSVCMFTACSSDDDDVVTPVFPQVQTIAGAAGEVKEFTFDANESWSLSSNKIWCKIAQNDAENGFVINGTAGKQTVKVTLTDDDASKDMSVAQLNLKMGGQEVTIAEIQRSAEGYELKVYDELGNDITETGITVGYKNVAGQPIYNKFIVKSTYRFAVTNTPAWVELEGGFLVGTPNKEVVGGAAFKDGQGLSAKYVIAKEDNYTITFASEDGKAAVTVPVMYNGMTTNTMDVTYPTVSPWAVWNVSMDGKVFSQNSTSLTGEATNDFTFHNFVPFQLNTFNDDYQLVVFESKENGLFEDSSGAVKLQGEKGDVKLTVAPLTSGSREFLVYALPKAVYESLENGFDDMLENEFTTVKSDYDRYFLMNLVQKENKVEAKAPTVLRNNWENLECKKDQSGMYTEVVNSYLNYYGDEVYVVNATVGKAVTVYPNITDWAPNEEDFSNVYCFDSSGEPVSPEPGMDEKDNWIFTLQVTENAPIFMAFKDASGNVLRVLVIERDDY